MRFCSLALMFLCSVDARLSNKPSVSNTGTIVNLPAVSNTAGKGNANINKVTTRPIKGHNAPNVIPPNINQDRPLPSRGPKVPNDNPSNSNTWQNKGPKVPNISPPNMNKVTSKPNRGPEVSNVYPEIVNADFPSKPSNPNGNNDWRAKFIKQCQQSAQISQNVDEYFLKIMQASLKNIVNKFKPRAGLISHIKQQINMTLDVLPDGEGDTVSDTEKEDISEFVKKMVKTLLPKLSEGQDDVIEDIGQIFQGMPEPIFEPEDGEEERMCHTMRELLLSFKGGMCQNIQDDILKPGQIGRSVSQGKAIKGKLSKVQQDFNAVKTGSHRFNSEVDKEALPFGFETSGESRSFYVNRFVMTVVILSGTVSVYL